MSNSTPEQIHARRLAAYHLTPQPCEVCGVTPANAHHDDYARPLDVRWLCDTHHNRLHAAWTASARARRERIAQRSAQARRLRAEGHSYSQIGALMGCSVATAYSYVTGKPNRSQREH